MDSAAGQLFLAAFTFGGWIVAAVLVGLYVGERGRRRDAQRREGVIEVDPIKPATVRNPDSSVPATVTEDVTEAKERYIEEAMTEGYSRDEAEADWAEMIQRAGSDGSSLDEGRVI